MYWCTNTFTLSSAGNTMRKKFLLGTGNPTKIEHYKSFLSDLNYDILTLNDVSIADQPEETGKTFEENAVIKADYYYKKTGLPVIADDAGFEIPALNNFPGVLSGRFFGGKRLTDSEIIAGILEKMKGLAGDERKGRFRVVIALKLSDTVIHTESGAIEGHVPETPLDKEAHHFPYRSLLFVDKLNKWFYDVTEEEEDRLGYRKAAVNKLMRILDNTV